MELICWFVTGTNVILTIWCARELVLDIREEFF